MFFISLMLRKNYKLEYMKEIFANIQQSSPALKRKKTVIVGLEMYSVLAGPIFGCCIVKLVLGTNFK